MWTKIYQIQVEKKYKSIWKLSEWVRVYPPKSETDKSHKRQQLRQNPIQIPKSKMQWTTCTSNSNSSTSMRKTNKKWWIALLTLLWSRKLSEHLPFFLQYFVATVSVFVFVLVKYTFNKFNKAGMPPLSQISFKLNSSCYY